MKQENEKGLALIVAIIFSALLIGIAATVASIVGRDILLSSVNNESTKALAMADLGIECALYADWVSGDSNDVSTSSNDASLECGGAQVTVKRPPGPDPTACLASNSAKCDCLFNPLKQNYPESGSATTTFWFGDDFRNAGACGCVDVGKRYEMRNGTEILITRVESRGYNTCDPNNANRVERALRVTYGE